MTVLKGTNYVQLGTIDNTKIRSIAGTDSVHWKTAN